jgi:beta-phosphoglucomutase-like phosphatase (HAD superfamily)
MMKGIIFDFNGVLWWDTHIQERSWREYSTTLRGKPLAVSEMEIHVHGRTNRHTMEYLVNRPLDDARLAQLVEEKESIYRRMCLDEGPGFRLSPGAEELLDGLTAARIPMTIATASGKINLDFFIEHLEIETWFDPSLIAYDDGTYPGKPAPDIYIRAAEKIQLTPGECAVVEDSVSGLTAAYRAGIGTIIALAPARRHADLLSLQGVNEAVTDLHAIGVERFTSHRAEAGKAETGRVVRHK